MAEPAEILRAKLNGETAKLGFSELQRHHGSMLEMNDRGFTTQLTGLFHREG